MPVTISRYYLTIRSGAGRWRVHYRMADSGPPLLLVHWRCDPASCVHYLHAPGRGASLAAPQDGLEIDLPERGLSSNWCEAAPLDRQVWQEVIDAVAAHFGIERLEFGPLPKGEADRLYPDLRPDRFGTYLTAAWSIVGASKIFSPWYPTSKDTAIPLKKAASALDWLTVEHRALIRGSAAAKALHIARERARV